MPQMTWKKLLSDVRVRELLGGEESRKLKVDPRSEFERDYDRLVFSAPFRRLQDKAQVFPLDPSDAVRTRLTHSHEVSILARDIADDVADWLVAQRTIGREEQSKIPAIAATCGLMHDMGNPPFGHSGEQAISDWFVSRFVNQESSNAITDSDVSEFKAMSEQQQRDFLLFDGNPQTIRVLSSLKSLFQNCSS